MTTTTLTHFPLPAKDAWELPQILMLFMTTGGCGESSSTRIRTEVSALGKSDWLMKGHSVRSGCLKSGRIRVPQVLKLRVRKHLLGSTGCLARRIRRKVVWTRRRLAEGWLPAFWYHAHMSESPTNLLTRLISLFPDFRLQWKGPDNLFKEDDGRFTYCGVLAEFSHFFRAQFDSLKPDALAALGDLLSECMASSNEELVDAVATCFLENVSCERFSTRFRSFLPCLGCSESCWPRPHLRCFLARQPKARPR
jgi:hypothetical protein